MNRDIPHSTNIWLRGLALALCFLGAILLPHLSHAQTTTAAQVDVVFVMDTSGSMGDEFTALCAEISLIVTELENQGVSVHYKILNIHPPLDAYIVSCAEGYVSETIAGATATQSEDWGPAVRDVSVGYNWQPKRVRVIIPISDEGPALGNPCDDPGPDRAAIQQAILAAQNNRVRVAPILGTGHENEACIANLADVLARSTGGRVFYSTTPATDLARGIQEIIGAVAEDRDGDGISDGQDPAPDDPCQPDRQAVCLPQQVCGISNTPHWDDDKDGRSDEELPDGQDDDGDGLVDEDLGGPNCPYPRQDCGVNNRRGFDDDDDRQMDEEEDNDRDDDGDGYIDEDVACPCPPPQTSGQETPVIDDDHDGRVDEELLNSIDDDGDGCIDEDISSARLQILFPAKNSVTWMSGPPMSVNGTSLPGAGITIYQRRQGQDAQIGTATTDQAGKWTLPQLPVACGATTLWAETSQNGQTSRSDEAVLLVRPDPPGTFLREGEREGGFSASFSWADRFVATYYYYWYDADDPNNSHMQALAERNKYPETANSPANPFTWRYDNIYYHDQELEDMQAAGIDVILPVYWGVSCEEGQGTQSHWSNAGLQSIVAAARQMLADGAEPPKIGMFYDTTSLAVGSGYLNPGEKVDLATVQGRERFYVPMRDFYSLVPPALRAEVDGRPLVWFHNPQEVINPSPEAFEYAREQFSADFNGKTPWFVVEDTWPPQIGDERHQRGATMSGIGSTLPGAIASIGPGIDERHLPGITTPRYRPRDGGAFYRQNWEEAIRLREQLRAVVVETWNAQEEDSGVNVSDMYGRQYVDLTADYAFRFKVPQVPYVGMPRLDQTPMEFWRLTDFEDRLLDAINMRRAQSGRQPLARSLMAAATAMNEAQLNLIYSPTRVLPTGGYRIRSGPYWLYGWSGSRTGTGGFPALREVESLVSDIEKRIGKTRANDRLMGQRILGVEPVCLAFDQGFFGCAIVLDYRPAPKAPSLRSPANDADFGVLQTGDILVNANVVRSVLDVVDYSQLLGYGALWHHAGIYVGDNQVVEAGTDGVQLVSLQDSSFWSSEHAAIYRARTSEAIRWSAADYARAQVGKPYNYNLFDKGTTRSFYCSQIPWAAYRYASGRTIDLDQNGGTPWWLDVPGLVTPDDLIMNDKVQHVSGGGTFLVGNWHAHSPIDFYVTDPQGRRAGMDPLLKRPVVEIPGATYDFEREPKHVSVSNLQDGEYIVTIVGTGEGAYGLESAISGIAGRSTDAMTRTITVGQVEAFGVTVSAGNLLSANTQLQPTSVPPLVRPGIVGAALGGLAVAVLLVGAAFVMYNRNRPAQRAGLWIPEDRWIPMTAATWPIGRDPGNRTVLPSDSVSRRHAVIRRAGATYTIEDLDSTTGTFVNHHRITRAVLHDGDEIGIGETLMVFRTPGQRRVQ